MPARFLLATLLGLSCLAHAEPPPLDHEAGKAAALDRYLDRVEKQRAQLKRTAKADAEGAIKSAQQSVSAAKRSIVDTSAPGIVTFANGDGPTTYPSLQSKNQAVADAEKDLQAARKMLAEVKAGKYEPPEPVFRLAAENLRLGEVGRIGECQVFQVIDATNVLVKCFYAGNAQTISRGGGATVRIGSVGGNVIVWIANRSTAGMTDNKGATIDDVLWASRTETYETQNGNKTVFVLEPLK